MSIFLKSRDFIKKHEKLVAPIALFGGFIIDSLTLQRIDMLFENIILGGYLILSGILIFALSFFEYKEEKNLFFERIRPFLSVILLIFLGGIFSGFTIFYVRSANFFSAWPFLILLIGVMVGTEYLKKHFTKIIIQVAVFYFALFSYLIFLIPILIKQVGPWVFILSGVSSLLLIIGYVWLLENFIGGKFIKGRVIIFKFVTGIFILVNFLYFTNIIPPIPLSLKEVGVYHYVEKQGSDYKVLDEKRSFLDRVTLYEKVRIKRGESLYIFSSIFAPTKLNAKVIHEWQFKESNNKWITLGKIPYSISGGSDTGYRGFSTKSGLTEGNWRVNIKTSNGQIIGRKNFEVIFITGEQELFSDTK